MKLYLARHGESVGNVKRLLYGRSDYPLSPRGEEDARLLGEKLREIPIARCYASPLRRAFRTAEIALADRDVPVRSAAELMEQDMGELEQVEFEAMRQEKPEYIAAMLADWSKVTPPGGESYEDVRQRVNACAGEILRRDEDALIVAHNGPLSVLLMETLSAPTACLGSFWFAHGCFSCLEFGRDRPRLLYFNR